MTRLIGFVLWLMALPLPSAAFDLPRHAALCDMAYQQVSPQTRAHIDALIKQAPVRNFAEGCGWADTIREQKRWSHTKPWHFLNVARTAKEVHKSDCPSSGCVLSAIEDMQQRLQNSPNTDWQALLFLAHFIGDLHQPMHISFADDRGGNRTNILTNRGRSNLHQWLDGDLWGRTRWQTQATDWLADITPSERNKWQQATLLEWATESLALTQQRYRELPAKNQTLSEEDQTRWQTLMAQRIQQASVRLALSLDRVFTQDGAK